MPLPRNTQRTNRDPRWSSPEPPVAPEAPESPQVVSVVSEPEEVVNDPRWTSPDLEIAPPAAFDPDNPPRFVRVLHHQVGIYPQGKLVETVMFENLHRLLDMGAVAYDATATEASPIDETAAIAARLAQPLRASQTIPRAPWAASSVGDLLGPATPRPTRFEPGAPSHQTITEVGGTHEVT